MLTGWRRKLGSGSGKTPPSAGRAAQVGEAGDLGQDGDGDLPGRLAAKVQADGGVKAPDLRLGEAGGRQAGAAFRQAPARAQGSHIEGL